MFLAPSSIRRVLAGVVVAASLSVSEILPSSKGLPTVAVLPFQPMGVDSTQCQILSETLSYELLKTGRVRVMERSQIRSVLAEQGFSQSGACDATECALQVGRLLGVEGVVLGSVGKIGNTYALNLRQVSMSTGEIISISSQRTTGEMERLLERSVPSAARELFPGIDPVKNAQPKVAANRPDTGRGALEPHELLPSEIQAVFEVMAVQSGGNGGADFGGRVRLWWDLNQWGVFAGCGGWRADGENQIAGFSLAARRDAPILDNTSWNIGFEQSFAYFDGGSPGWKALSSLSAGVAWRFHENIALGAGYGIGFLPWDPVHRFEASLTFGGW